MGEESASGARGKESPLPPPSFWLSHCSSVNPTVNPTSNREQNAECGTIKISVDDMVSALRKENSHLFMGDL